MKSKFLIATAVASIFATAGLANAAENEHEGGHPDGGAPAAHSAPAAPHAQSQGAPNRAMESRPQENNRAQAPKAAPTENRAQQTPSENRAKEGNTPRNTMGQAEPKNGKSDRLDAQGRTDRGAAENRGTSEPNRGTAQGNTGNRGASASLSSEQRTKIRQTVLNVQGAPRVSRNDLDINLSVGARIPRDHIHFRPLPLPPTIVEIEPEWRGYDYFLVGDEVVVVDPDTFEVVAVIPA
jgi:hypothetical protein